MKKGILMICAAALAMSLSSCGLYTKYDKATSVDEKLYGDAVADFNEPAPADSLNIGNISWREIFTDKILQGYIEQALAKNSDLQSALLRVNDAESSLVASRLAYLPTVALSGEGTLSGLVEGGNTPSKVHTEGLAVSWDIDIFGRVTNTKLIAKSQFEQQIYAAQAVQSKVVATVATLYYTLSMLDEQIEISTSTEVSWEESLKAAVAMKEAGMMNDAGVKQIEASLMSVQSALLDIKRSREETNNALCALLAQTPRELTTGELKSVVLPAQIAIGVPLHLLSSRPDVMMAEAALAASFYSENVARSAFYPSLSLSGFLGWTNDMGTVVLNPADLIFSAVGSVAQPIFTKGLNRAQLKIAKSQFEQSRIAFEQQLLDAGIEVNDALVTLVTTAGKTRILTKQVEALSSAAESTAMMMKHGSTTYLEVLSANQSLYNAQLGAVGNTFDEVQGMISLYLALGGGRF